MDFVIDAQQQIITQYPQLFVGLSSMRDPYTIRIKPDAQPYSVFAPRRIPLPLLSKVKKEIDRLLRPEVIARVEELTPWCAPIVVVQKQTGGIRLYVDHSKLNDSVLCELHILPSLD